MRIEVQFLFFYSKMKINIIKIFCVIVFLLITACSEDENVIAEFGDEKITLDEFKIAYLDVIKKPDVYDSKKLREEFLDELINTRILANEANRQKFQIGEKLQLRIDAYINKTLRTAHFDSIIRPKFSIEESNIEEAYLYTQEERNISHLFFTSSKQADEFHSRLKQGESFSNLAQEIFGESELGKSGGELGWVKWDQFEYDLAMTAFREPLDTFSIPVKSQFGYHIIKVNDFKKNPLITRQQYEDRKNKAKYMLEFKLGEKYAFDYVEKMLKNAEVKIIPEVIMFVEERIEKNLTREPNKFDEMSEIQLNENEIARLEESIWDRRNDVISIINGREITVGELIGALAYVPYQVLQSSFKEAFNYTVRDFLITEEAQELGLQNNKQVKLKAKMYEEYLTQLEFRRKLISRVEVEDSEIIEYYQLNKAKFKKTLYEECVPVINKILLRQKRRNKIPEIIDSLSSDLTIEKKTEVLHSYYDSIIKNRL